MTRKYSGFTLVEMLIVMGILSVLMAIGVSVARFAVQRANNIQHQSAVDQMFQALQSYYTDNREYPTIGDGTSTDFVDFETALGTGGVLDQYVDANFDGGAAARYYYFVDNTSNSPQAFLVCVSFSEPTAITNDDQGGYCNGNGFGDGDVTGGEPITTKEIAAVTFQELVEDQSAAAATSDWDGATQSWGGVLE